MAPDDLPKSPLLSDSLRDFLTEGQPDDVDDESRKRYRTRKRVKEIVAEFDRLLEHWPDSEIRTTFSDPDDGLEQGMKAVIALFYLASYRRDFERLIESGVYQAEQRMNSKPSRVECDISIDKKEPTRDPEVLMNMLDGDHTNPTDEEIGIILKKIEQGDIPEEYRKKLPGW